MIDGALQINAGLSEALERKLRPSEFIQWQGQPSARIFMVPGLFKFAVGIALLFHYRSWIEFFTHLDVNRLSIFWVLILGAVIGFVLVGIWMLFAPLFAVRTAHRTIYAITNQRALIFTKEFWKAEIESIDISLLTAINSQSKPNGIGDLILQGSAVKDGEQVELKFRSIEDAAELESLVRKTKEKAS